MACEVPGNASRGSEKRSAAPGGFPVAEAKVQATSSLPLQEIEQEFYRGSRKRFPRVGRGAPFWGHVEELTLETLSPVASEVPAKHFFSETLLLPETGIAKMPPERLCWPILGLLLGPCSPILGLCWGYVATSWPPVGPCCGRCWAVGYPRR